MIIYKHLIKTVTIGSYSFFNTFYYMFYMFYILLNVLHNLF